MINLAGYGLSLQRRHTITSFEPNRPVNCSIVANRLQEGQIIDLGPDFIAEASREDIARWYYEGIISFIDNDGNEYLCDKSFIIEKPEVKRSRKEREIEV